MESAEYQQDERINVRAEHPVLTAIPPPNTGRHPPDGHLPRSLGHDVNSLYRPPLSCLEAPSEPVISQTRPVASAAWDTAPADDPVVYTPKLCDHGSPRHLQPYRGHALTRARTSIARQISSVFASRLQVPRVLCRYGTLVANVLFWHPGRSRCALCVSSENVPPTAVSEKCSSVGMHVARYLLVQGRQQEQSIPLHSPRRDVSSGTNGLWADGNENPDFLPPAPIEGLHLCLHIQGSLRDRFVRVFSGRARVDEDGQSSRGSRFGPVVML